MKRRRRRWDFFWKARFHFQIHRHDALEIPLLCVQHPFTTFPFKNTFWNSCDEFLRRKDWKPGISCMSIRCSKVRIFYDFINRFVKISQFFQTLNIQSNSKLLFFVVIIPRTQPAHETIWQFSFLIHVELKWKTSDSIIESPRFHFFQAFSHSPQITRARIRNRTFV